MHSSSFNCLEVKYNVNFHWSSTYLLWCCWSAHSGGDFFSLCWGSFGGLSRLVYSLSGCCLFKTSLIQFSIETRNRPTFFFLSWPYLALNYMRKINYIVQLPSGSQIKKFRKKKCDEKSKFALSINMQQLDFHFK